MCVAVGVISVAAAEAAASAVGSFRLTAATEAALNNVSKRRTVGTIALVVADRDDRLELVAALDVLTTVVVLRCGRGACVIGLDHFRLGALDRRRILRHGRLQLPGRLPLG